MIPGAIASPSSASFRTSLCIPATAAMSLSRGCKTVSTCCARCRCSILWGMKDFVFDHHFLDEWVRHFPDGGGAPISPSRATTCSRTKRTRSTAWCRLSRGPPRHQGARRLSQTSAPAERSNIAIHLSRMAMRQPHTMAVVVPDGRDRGGRVRYTHLTYRQLDQDSNRIAHGLEGDRESAVARGPW